MSDRSVPALRTGVPAVRPDANAPVPHLPAHPVTREQAEAAVATLLAYIGEDVARPGLIDTPARVVRTLDEFYAGYAENPDAALGRVFEDLQDYDDLVLMRNINFISHCEHHMLPITGVAHIAYWPGVHVVGISKLVRLVEVYARRLQSQEAMTRAIADSIERVLEPKGVAVLIEAQHTCMTTRGVAKPDVDCVTQELRGCFSNDTGLADRFLRLTSQRPGWARGG